MEIRPSNSKVSDHNGLEYNCTQIPSTHYWIILSEFPLCLVVITCVALEAITATSYGERNSHIDTETNNTTSILIMGPLLYHGGHETSERAAMLVAYYVPLR